MVMVWREELRNCEAGVGMFATECVVCSVAMGGARSVCVRLGVIPGGEELAP